MKDLRKVQAEDPYSGDGRNKLVMRDGRVFDIGHIVNTVSVYVEEGDASSPAFKGSPPDGTPNDTINLNFDSKETVPDNEPSYFITQKEV